MNFSCLSEAEVREKYRRADDKHAMLKVLMELTLSTKADMMAFLGVEEKPISRKARRPAVSVNKELVRKYYNAGMSDRAIAEALGVSKSAVARWRYMNELGPNHAAAEACRQRLQEYARLYLEGHSDGYIARATGVRNSTVAAWRERNGLPPNFKRGQYDRRTVNKHG